MPGSLKQVDSKFPDFRGGETTDEKINAILDYLFVLREELEYLFGHLGTENFSQQNLEELQNKLRGSTGARGPAGPPGKTAYQVAVDEGYTGTEEEWLESLIGPQGQKGDTGETGPRGETGPGGKSAYDIAVEEGYTGTEAEWLASLVGPQGIQGPAGEDGKSAYEVAVDEGYTGTEAEWLASLVGPQGQQGIQGPQGKSAYEQAVEGGYTGTEAEFMEMLANTVSYTAQNPTQAQQAQARQNIGATASVSGTRLILSI